MENHNETTTDSKSIIMNDNCVEEALKHLNFNEKSICRLVSHQFRRVVDSFVLKKLVVFDRTPISKGKFSMTDDDYTEADSVYVPCLERFFNNKFIVQRLANVSKLKIIGLDQMEFSCTMKFKALIHLELNNVRITNRSIFESPNLKKLLMSNAYLCTATAAHFHHLGLGSLTNKLAHFSTTDILPSDAEIEFYRMAHEAPMLSELETLDCHLMSFKTLVYISNNFHRLKTVNVRFATCRDEMIDLLRTGLDKLVRKLRPDLKVFLFGIPLVKGSVKIVENFLYEHGLELHFGFNSLGIKVGSDWNSFSKEFGRHSKLLSGFFKLIDTVIYEDPVADESTINRLTNVSQAFFKIWLDVKHGLPDQLALYPNIKHLGLNSFPDGHYHNDVLDMIPIYCTKLLSLNMDNWETDVNYSFLLGLTSIQTIRIFTRLQFDQELYMDMLRQLTNLSFLEIWYELTDSITKDDLSKFKHTVEDYINNELTFNDCTLKVQIHRRSSYIGDEKFAFVRIVMKRTARDSANNSMLASEGDIRKMMWCIGYKREHPESSDEIDRYDLRYGRSKVSEDKN
ncbi:uncharacterized protein LOC119069363 [Bradysia coprophila]|uniref:uncharacterized protein LOC119069363 n=1 Tax=Bradysia coprophila TaxID=38358 RepID=UPI00187DD5E6|nr:uncharacterized protein LOC119069363 [Bradysia coprophila]